MKRKLLLGLVGLALAGIFATGALAAPAPLPNVLIEAEDFFANPGGETFTAIGPAKDSGLVCASGTVQDISFRKSGPPNGDFEKWHVVRRFICDDQSGTFDVRLRVNLDLVTWRSTGNWQITEGTGNYSSLTGKGTLDGTPLNLGVVNSDYYVGTVE